MSSSVNTTLFLPKDMAGVWIRYCNGVYLEISGFIDKNVAVVDLVNKCFCYYNWAHDLITDNII
jgi:hypothetical protein